MSYFEAVQHVSCCLKCKWIDVERAQPSSPAGHDPQSYAEESLTSRTGPRSRIFVAGHLRGCEELSSGIDITIVRGQITASPLLRSWFALVRGLAPAFFGVIARRSNGPGLSPPGIQSTREWLELHLYRRPWLGLALTWRGGLGWNL